MANPWDAIHANKGLEVTLHLTEEEVGNINGWVLRGFSDQSVANNPPEIVLVARTRDRFNDLAGQFVQAGLCSPPAWFPWDQTEPPKPPQPPKPPTGIPVAVQDEIRYGDFSRHIFTDGRDLIHAFPFRIPTPPPGGFPGPNGGLLRLSVAEWGTKHLRATSLSVTPGDMGGPIVSNGGETAAFVMCGDDFPYGALVYINTMATEDCDPASAQSSVSIIWPPLVYP